VSEIFILQIGERGNLDILACDHEQSGDVDDYVSALFFLKYKGEKKNFFDVIGGEIS
jgi:hypothetical protein